MIPGNPERPSGLRVVRFGLIIGVTEVLLFYLTHDVLELFTDNLTIPFSLESLLFILFLYIPSMILRGMFCAFYYFILLRRSRRRSLIVLYHFIGFLLYIPVILVLERMPGETLPLLFLSYGSNGIYQSIIPIAAAIVAPLLIKRFARDLTNDLFIEN